MKTHRLGKPLAAAFAVAFYAWLAAAPADAIAQRTWVGQTNGSRQFSTSANWDGATAITAGDFLTFGSEPGYDGDVLNDLNAFSVTRLTFTGGGFYTLKGNPLTVTESVIFNEDGGNHSIELNLLGKAETLVAAGARVHLSGANSFTGKVQVLGELYVDSNGALGTAAAGTNVGPGGLLRMTGRDLVEPISVDGPANDPKHSTCIQSDGGTTILRDVQFSGDSCAASLGDVNFPNGIKVLTPDSDVVLGLGAFRVGGTSAGTGTVRPVLTNLVWNSTSTLNLVVGDFQGVSNESNLSGSGSAASLDFTGGGLVSPGTDAGPGRLSFSGAFRVDHAKVSFGLKGTTAGTGHSTVQAGGPVVIGPETEMQLALYVGYTPTVGSQYRIIDNTLNQPITGTFKGLPEGAKFFQSGLPWSITYKGGTGNDVVVTALQPDLRPFKRFVPLVAAGN